MNNKELNKAIAGIKADAIIRRTPDYQAGYWNGFHGEAATMTTDNYKKGYSDGKADANMETVLGTLFKQKNT